MATQLPTDSDTHSYFVPMVDMLAGVVFVLVILLAAMTLVQRDEFAHVAGAEAEIARINEELAKARSEAEKVLEPRRRAEAALRLLLQRLQDGLARQGVAATIDPVAGRLSLAADDLFLVGSAQFSKQGSVVANALAVVLDEQIPCLSSNPSPEPDCAEYDGQTLTQASLASQAAADSSAPVAAARSLVFLSQVVTSRTSLAGLEARSGGRLLSNSDFVARQPPSAASDASAPREHLVLDFRMQVEGR